MTMAAKSSKTLPMMLMAVACMAMLVPTGLAQLSPEPQFIADSKLSSEQNVFQCWSSLLNIQGCVVEKLGFLFNGRIGVIGPACCKAITEISDNCWLKMFPFNPLFPLLKSFCIPSGGAAPAPKAIGSTTTKTFSRANILN